MLRVKKAIRVLHWCRSPVDAYYPLAKAVGVHVWEDVLECGVSYHPGRSISNLENGSDYYCTFATHSKALTFFPKY
jgi:hypothetical protein